MEWRYTEASEGGHERNASAGAKEVSVTEQTIQKEDESKTSTRESNKQSTLKHIKTLQVSGYITSY